MYLEDGSIKALESHKNQGRYSQIDKAIYF